MNSAFRIALQFAKHEYTLDGLKQSNKTPADLVRNEQERMEKSKEYLDKNPAALEYLDVARAYVRAEDAREIALENLLLGKFEKALFDWSLIDPREFADTLDGDSDERLQKSWTQFFKSLEDINDKERFYESIMYILSAIKIEILHQNLPPAPVVVLTN